MGIVAKHIIVALIISFTCTSCVTVGLSLMGFSVHKVYVTDDTEYHHFYKLGQAYRLRINAVFQIQVDAPQLKRSLNLLPGTTRTKDSGWEEFYTKKKDQWYLKMLEDKPDPKGVVIKDTRFEIVRFTMLKYNIDNNKSWMVHPMGRILDGPYIGTEFYVSDNLSEIVLLNNEQGIAFRPGTAIELVE